LARNASLLADFLSGILHAMDKGVVDDYGFRLR
jgi:hypothetical protein